MRNHLRCETIYTVRDAILADKEVLWLDVAVDNTLKVEVLEAAGHLTKDVPERTLRKCITTVCPRVATCVKCAPWGASG